MIMIDDMLLRRKLMVTLPENKCYVSTSKIKRESAVVAMIKNIQSLGFTFDGNLVERMIAYDIGDLKDIYVKVRDTLQQIVGADKEYNPMYPNFPYQVACASDAELYINALIHYCSGGIIVPDYKEELRMPLLDDVNLKVITVGTHEDVMEVFTNLVSSKTNLSEQDKGDIAHVFSDYADYANYLPDEIPLKENVALVGKLMIDNSAIKDASVIQKYFHTATDVLRLITAMSGGDLSLAVRTKYRSLKRYERRMIMDLLAGCGQILEDLYRYHYEWIRVGEILHPFEYKSEKYEDVNNAFSILRNSQKKPRFIPGMVEEAINSGDIAKAAEILMQRPGDFARRLDKLLRSGKDSDVVLKSFNMIADQVSIPVLLQVRQHFLDRNKENPLRVFFPKGSCAKVMAVRNDLPEISDKICKHVVRICNTEIVSKLSEREPLGNVYVDPDLQNYIVPFSQRSASNGSHCLVRGSRIRFNKDATTARGFIWWTNTEDDEDEWGSRVDIDLSAALFGEDWSDMGYCSYTHLRSNGMYHSGDITNGGRVNGKGVSEFLDVDFDKVVERGARYLVFQVYCYTGQKYSDLPNCRFGWMQREDVNSGEIYEPSTVDMSIDLTSNSTVAIPVIFDCKEKEVIWCDMNLSLENTRDCIGGNNIESNVSAVAAACYAMVHMSKTNMYALAKLNALARGDIVSSRDEADVIFSNNKDLPEGSEQKVVSATDFDYIASQML